MNRNNLAIILSAGKGERYGRKKQFIEFIDKPLYRHVLDKVEQVLPSSNIITVGVDIEGGTTRSESVRRGLDYFSNKKKVTNKVIILEAARPLVTIQQINALLDSESDSVTFVMPLVNTVIKRNCEYVNREDFYDLLTPQAFDYKKLYNAYKKNSNVNLTDETYLMYKEYGIKPEFKVDGQNLVKLTYLKDLPILEHLYKLQKEGVL